MPVFGYLAIAKKGKLEQLRTDLGNLAPCQVVIPARERDILVLVTDTPDEEAEKALKKRLLALDSLQSLAMTFGHDDTLTDTTTDPNTDSDAHIAPP